MIGIGVLVVVGLLALVIHAARGGHHRRVVTTSSTTVPASTTSAPETTLTLEPVSQPTATSAPPASTATTALGPALNGQGAILATPSVPDSRHLLPGQTCQSLGDPGWQAQCASVGTAALWLTETRPAGSATATRAYLFVATSGASPATASPNAPPRPTTTVGPVSTTSSSPATTVPAGSEWSVALVARDDAGGRFSRIAVVTGDARGTGHQAALFGFHDPTNGGVLRVDLVELAPDVVPPAVTVHLDLARGALRLSTGQVDTWAASFLPGDAACCPSAFVHQVLHFQAAAWRVVADTRVSPDSVPPSQI